MHLYGEDASLALVDVPGGGLRVTITIPAPASRSRAERHAAVPA
jgi:hypothetical protein